LGNKRFARDRRRESGFDESLVDQHLSSGSNVSLHFNFYELLKLLFLRYEYGAQLCVLGVTSAVCLSLKRFFVLPVLATLITQRFSMRLSSKFIYGKLDQDERKTFQNVLKRELQQNRLHGRFGNDYLDLGKLWLTTRIKMLE
jgi:hypothetical protein